MINSVRDIGRVLIFPTVWRSKETMFCQHLSGDC